MFLFGLFVMLLLICRNFLYILGQSPLSDMGIHKCFHETVRFLGLCRRVKVLFSVSWTKIELKLLGAGCLVRKSAQTALISYPHQWVLPSGTTQKFCVHSECFWGLLLSDFLVSRLGGNGRLESFSCWSS